MQTSDILYKQSKIQYASSPTGKNPIICFHGYGESGKSFAFLQAYLPAAYKIICIDLPYHGGTQWNEGTNFRVEDLIDIIDQIFRIEKIATQQFSVIGYSLGGRI